MKKTGPGRIPALLLAILLLSLAGALFIRFSRSAPKEYRRTFPALGTFATVIVTAPEGTGQGILDSTAALLFRLDEELGRFSHTGPLHSLNTTGSVALDTELGRLLLRSVSLAEAAEGAFDPTLGALTVLWGFPEPRGVPDSLEIAFALENTGWRTMLTVSGDSLYVHNGVLVDLGAIAKGYAADTAWALAMASGALECLIEIGGEIRFGGSTGRVWNIGVRHPANDALAGVLSLTEGAVATSGVYENFFLENGVRYSHLLDPRTGYPASAAMSATVIALDCLTADAMATAAAVAGPDGAAGFSSNEYRGMIIITADGAVHEYGEVPWQGN